MPPVLPEECHEHLRNGNYHNCGIPVARLLRVVRGLPGAANGCHRLGAVGDFLPAPAPGCAPIHRSRALRRGSPTYKIHRYAAITRSASKNPVKTKVNPTRSVSSGTIFAISLSLSASSLASSLSAICSSRRGASPRKETRDENI